MEMSGKNVVMEKCFKFYANMLNINTIYLILSQEVLTTVLLKN